MYYSSNNHSQYGFSAVYTKMIVKNQLRALKIGEKTILM